MRTNRTNRGVLPRTPLTPRVATTAKSTMAAMQIARAAMSTGLRPHDWERRPQTWLVRTTMTAATLMVNPICHSSSPTSRDSGAMTGLRVVCPR